MPGQVGVSGWQERLKSASEGVQKTLTVKIIVFSISTVAIIISIVHNYIVVHPFTGLEHWNRLLEWNTRMAFLVM